MENSSFNLDLLLLKRNSKENDSSMNIENLRGINWEKNKEKIEDIQSGIFDILDESNSDLSSSSISLLGLINYRITSVKSVRPIFDRFQVQITEILQQVNQARSKEIKESIGLQIARKVPTPDTWLFAIHSETSDKSVSYSYIDIH